MQVKQLAPLLAEQSVREAQSLSEGRLIILGGLQYSGKTWLAKQLQAKGYVHLFCTPFRKAHQLATEEMYEIGCAAAEILLKQGYAVVVDHVNHLYEVREMYRLSAQKYQAPCQLVYLDIPEEIRRMRWQENVAAGSQEGRRIIPLEEQLSFAEAEELPCAQEAPVFLRNSGEVQAWLSAQPTLVG